MSKQIEERVVEMKFDNKDFESNVKTSMSTLDKLKQKLSFKDASKGLDNLDKAAKNVKMDSLGKSVEVVRTKFSALEVMGVTALANITNSAINAGKRIAASLTIEPITTGFNEYEMKIDSIRTIIASTGESVQTVNDYLNELNTYSDRTIYSFADMTQNIGKFTNAGVKLEDAVNAIKGISNEAAVSGANANEASRAMYNFAQALSAGYVKLIDWKSIELANMATVEFKQQLIDTAVATGTLVEASDGMYETLEGNTLSASRNFNETLQDQWMTSEVLIETLKKYADETTDIGKKAYSAAEDVTKFTQMMDVLKETAQSGWAKTWEIIFGDIEQAKAIFTPLTKFFSDIIDGISDFRNNLLEGALSSPFSKLSEKLSNVSSTVESSMEILEDYSEVVDKILKGDFGNGQARWDKLTEAGYDWAHAQNLVNEKLGDGTRYVTNLEKTQEKLTKQIEDLTDEELINIGLTEEEVELYRELEEQAKASGVSINELIENMGQMDGRSMLFESFNNIGKGLLQTIKSIKEAWVNIFPPMTSAELYNIISGFHTLSAKLKMSDETAEKLRRTFEGLFAALDIILTVLSGPIKLAFKALTKILSAADINILDLTASIGDVIVKFRDWLDSTLDFTKIFETFSPYLNKAIESIQKWSSEINLSGETITKVLNAIKEIWNQTFSNNPKDISKTKDALNELSRALNISDQAAANFEKIFAGVFSIIKSLNWVITGSLTTSFKLLKAVLELFGTNIIEVGAIVADYITKIRDWIDEHLLLANTIDEVANILKTLIDGIIGCVKAFSELEIVQQTIARFRDVISSLFGDISDGFGNVNITGFCNKLSEAFSKIQEWIRGLNDSENIGKDIVLGLLNGLRSGIQLVVNVVLQLGKAILDTIKSVLGIHSPSTEFFEIGENVITGFLNGLQNGASKIWEFVKGIGLKCIEVIKKIDFGKIFSIALAGSFISFLIVATKAVSDFTKVIDKIAAPLEGIGKMFSGIGKMFSGLGEKFKAQALTAKSKAILNMAISIGILAASVYLLSKVDSPKLWEAVGALAALAAIILILSAAASKINANGGDIAKLSTLLIGLSASMLIMSIALKKLEFLNSDNIGPILIGFGSMIAGLTIIVAALGLLVKGKTAQNIDKAGITILKISAAILLLTFVIKQISKLDPEAIKKGMICIALFGGIVTGIIAATRLAGKRIDAAGSSILKISAAILLLTFVIKQISKLNIGSITKGMICIALFGGIVTGLIAATRLAGGNDLNKVGSTILAMSAGILMLSIATKIMGSMDLKSMAKGLVCISLLSVIMTNLVAVTRVAGGNNLKGVAVTILAMSVSIGILAAVSVMLSLMSLEGLAKGITAVGLLSIMMSMMIRSTKDAQDCKGNIIAMSIAIGVMAASVVVLSLIDGSKLAGATAALSIVMGMFALMTKAASNITSSIPVLLIMTVAVGLMAGIIWLLSSLPIESVLASSASLSILLLSLSASMAILSLIGPTIATAIAGAIGMLALCVPLVAFVGILALMQNIQNAASNAIILASFATVMTGLLAVLTIIGGLAISAILGVTSLLAMSIPLISFVGILALMQNIQNAESNAKILITLMTVMTGLLAVVSILGPLALIGVTAISQMTMVMAKMAAFIAVIGALTSTFPQLETFINSGISLLINLASGLGQIIGSFISGFAQGITSGLPQIATDLSMFMMNLTPFIIGAKMVDETTVDGIKSLAETILILTGAGILEGIASWLTGGSSIEDFGKQLSKFGPYIKNFSDSVSGINEGAVTSAANAGKMISEMASTIPNSGGWLEKIVGGNDMSTFGSQLKGFGEAIVDFSEVVTGKVNEGAVNSAANAGKVITEMASAIPNSGGWLEKIVGGNDMSTFGSQLKGFGEALADFSGAVDGKINNGAVSNAVEAGKKISEISDIKFKISAKDISNIKNLGKSISDFAGSVSNIDMNGINSISDSFKKLADSGINNLANSFSNAKGQISASIKNMLSSSITIIKSQESSFKNCGKYLINNLAQGIKTSDLAIKNVIKSCVDNSVKVISSYYNSFNSAGKYLVEGFAKGITDNTFLAEAKAKAMAEAAYGAAKDALAVNSPSKKFMVIGSSVCEGLAKGIAKNVGYATDAAIAMSDNILSATQDRLKINSPSLVFDEGVGRYIAQGIGEGITKDMSPEEAAKKKASNIVNAFKEEFDRYDKLSRLEKNRFELWLMKDGVSATSAEIDKYRKEYADKVVEYRTQQEKLMRDEWQQTLEIFGKDSDEEKDALEKLAKAEKEVLNAKNIGVIQSDSKQVSSLLSFDEKLGRYIAKNIGKGLEGDMTPEEAAKKKAENIANAFKEEIDRHSKLASIAEKEFNLWQLTDGKYAKDEEIDKKQSDYLKQVLEHKIQQQKLAYDEWQQTLDVFKDGSDEEKEAWGKYIDSQIELENAKNDLTAVLENAKKRKYNELDKAQELLDAKNELWKLQNESLSDAKKAQQQVKYLNETLDGLIKEVQLHTEDYNKAVKNYGEKSSEALEELKKCLETSKEIAETKKEIAETLIGHFDTEIDNIDNLMDLRQLDYEKWELTTGKRASDAAKDRKLTEKLLEDQKDLHDKWTNENMKYWNYVHSKDFGPNSAEAKAADKARKEARNAYYENEKAIAQIEIDAIERERENLKTRLDLANKNADLRYQIWEKTEGRNASSLEKDVAKVGVLSAQLKTQTELLNVAREEYVEACKKYGKASNEAQEAYSEFLQKQLDIATLQSEITDIQESAADREKLALSDYKKYMDRYRKYYLMNGMTEAELEKDAKLVSGYDPNNTINTIITRTNEALNNVKNSKEYNKLISNFNSLGTEYVDAVNEGVREQTEVILATMTRISNNCVNELRSNQSKWTESGKHLVEGFAKGITASISIAISAVKVLAVRTISAMKSALNMHSPSKEFFDIGEYAVIGFANGFINNSKLSEDAVASVGENAIDNLKSTIKRVYDVINSDMETEPTIRPVLDLSNIEKGTARLNAMFSKTQAMRINATISKDMAEEIQNGHGSNGKTNIFNYTQNNYSPKALSRSEIYRQTKNQFSALKGALT